MKGASHAVDHFVAVDQPNRASFAYHRHRHEFRVVVKAAIDFVVESFRRDRFDQACQAAYRRVADRRRCVWEHDDVLLLDHLH